MQENGFDPWLGKIPWRRKWQPIPVFLTGKSHGQRSLAGYSPWSHRVRQDWVSMHTRSLKFCLCLWWDPHLSFLGSLWSCPKADSQSFLLSTNADGTCYTPASMVGSYDKVSQVEDSLYIYIYICICMYVCISLCEISNST